MEFKKDIYDNKAISSVRKNLRKLLKCESPTTLFRRCALERLEATPVNKTLFSPLLATSSCSKSFLPFDQLLNGVIGYVDIIYNNEDRSDSIKLLLKSMGALVRDKLSSGVTHVVFKDGSFATYQKAKLIKAHLVSILWVEAVRQTKSRVPEDRYPALGIENYEVNLSIFMKDSNLDQNCNTPSNPLTSPVSCSNDKNRENGLSSKDSPLRECSNLNLDNRKVIRRSKRKCDANDIGDKLTTLTELEVNDKEFSNSAIERIKQFLSAESRNHNRNCNLDGTPLTIISEDISPLRLSGSSKDKSGNSKRSTDSVSKGFDIEIEIVNTTTKDNSKEERIANKSKRRQLYNPEEEQIDLEIVDISKDLTNECSKSNFIRKRNLDNFLTPVSLNHYKDPIKLTKHPPQQSVKSNLIINNNENLNNFKTRKRLKKNEDKIMRKNDRLYETPTKLEKLQIEISKFRKINPHLNRRSTLDFVVKKETVVKRKNYRKINMEVRGIACTRLHQQESDIIKNIVKQLGSSFFEGKVTENTSHLIIGESRRTINLLKAVIRGCWILKREWVYDSLMAGKWLPEESFEINFLPAIEHCRNQRNKRATFSINIFRDCGLIFVGNNTIPKKSSLEELIRMCSGRITKIVERARISVGEKIKSKTICVKETWILDSITNNRKEPVENYLLS